MATKLHSDKNDLERKIEQLQKELDEVKGTLRVAKMEERFATLTTKCYLGQSREHTWSITGWEQNTSARHLYVTLKVSFRCLGCGASMESNTASTSEVDG